jgi:alkylation response protein AidB-like acyl-CoA dehydrogenase
MDFKFTEEQEMIRKMVSDFAVNEITPHIEAMERGEFPKTILQKMGVLGLMGIPIPEQYGGTGMDFMSYIIAINEISKVSPTLGVMSVHTSVGTNPIVYFGTDEQKQKYVPKLAASKFLGAFYGDKAQVQMLQFEIKGGKEDEYIE